nr:putative ribonuclease H-like domain-containing protein [Tanacetum cinerariifolium]
MNNLVKRNLVRGLPSKLFENDHACVACQKGKKHRASCKSKTENSISLPLHLLHVDLFGPTFVKSLMKKMYCLVVTDDYSRFTWVFFLATKDETSGILKSFITRIENLVDHKVKVIRCDNRTGFKNREVNQFCEMKEAVNTACYVQNRVLVVKPHNKTPYEFFMTADPPFSQDPKSSHDDGSKPLSDDGKKVDEDPRKENECNDQEKEDNVNNTNNVNTVCSTVNAAGTNEDNELPFDLNMPDMEDDSIFNFSNNDEDDGIVAGMNNLDTTIQVSPILTTRIHKDHLLDQVIGDLHSTTQIRNMYTQEEGIDYDEVFAHVVRIEAIRLFLAYASFKDFVGYQMDVKSAFLYEKIKEEVYVCQPPRFEDPDFLDRVYKVKKALYGLHQAPRAWYETLSKYLLDNGFQIVKIDKTLFIKMHKGDILLVQVYVDDIIFGSTKELCNAFERLMHEKF